MTALPAAQVEGIIADWAESAVTSRRTGIPPVRRHRDGALLLACLAFRVGTELLRRRDRQDSGYWLSLSVQAPTGRDWRRWRQAS
jgi:hypothetical protein